MSRYAPLICLAIGIGFVVTPSLWKLAHQRVPTPTTRFATHWRVPVPADLNTLDPNRAASDVDRNTLLLLYGRLIRRNSALDLEGDALESWAYNVQTQTYTFKLRPDIFFHDGKPLRTEDVIFSFHEWAKQTTPDHLLLSGVVGAKEFSENEAPSISGITALSDLSFEVRLREWEEHFIRNLASPSFVLYPDQMSGQTHETFFLRPNATGPYRVASFQPGRLEVEAFDRYYRGTPRTAIIELFHLDVEKAREEFQASKVNNLLFYDVADPAAFESESAVALPQAKQTTYVMVVNDTLPDLQSKAFRRLLAQRVDRKALLSCLPGTRPANSLIPTRVLPEKTEPAQKKTKARKRKAMELSFSSVVATECLKGHLAEAWAPLDVKLVDPPPAKKADLFIQSFDFFKDDLSYNIRFLDSRSDDYLLGSVIPDLQKLLSAITPGLSTSDVLRAHDGLDDFLVSEYRAIPVAHANHFSVFRRVVENAEWLPSPKFVANWFDVQILRDGNAN
ncbi:MAG: ABC transporter substrate-binding protein [Bdellovibrionota bacterium]